MEQFFETKVRYEKMQDNGTEKKVTETYIVDALSFTEAEKRITEQMQGYISGEYEVKAIRQRNFIEVIAGNPGDKWYEVKIDLAAGEDKKGKVKYTKANYLINALSIDEAKILFAKHMSGTLVDYVLKSVSETKIVDYFAYKD